MMWDGAIFTQRQLEPRADAVFMTGSLPAASP
jgi:hypothetical protein